MQKSTKLMNDKIFQDFIQSVEIDETKWSYVSYMEAIKIKMMSEYNLEQLQLLRAYATAIENKMKNFQLIIAILGFSFAFVGIVFRATFDVLINSTGGILFLVIGLIIIYVGLYKLSMTYARRLTMVTLFKEIACICIQEKDNEGAEEKNNLSHSK